MKVTIEINGEPHEIELSDEAVAALEGIVRRTGLDLEGALQQALVNENFLEQIARDGQLLVKKDDKLQELNFEPA